MELCPIGLLTSPRVYAHLWESLCVCVCVCVCVWLVFLTHGQTKRSARRGRTRLKRIWSRCFAGLSLTSFHQLSTSSFPSSFALMDAEWFAVFVETCQSGRLRGKTNRGCWHSGGADQETACAVGLGFILYVCLCLPYVLFVSSSVHLH